MTKTKKTHFHESIKHNNGNDRINQFSLNGHQTLSFIFCRTIDKICKWSFAFRDKWSICWNSTQNSWSVNRILYSRNIKLYVYMKWEELREKNVSYRLICDESRCFIADFEINYWHNDTLHIWIKSNTISINFDWFYSSCSWK